MSSDEDSGPRVEQQSAPAQVDNSKEGGCTRQRLNGPQPDSGTIRRHMFRLYVLAMCIVVPATALTDQLLFGHVNLTSLIGLPIICLVLLLVLLRKLPD